MLTGEVPLCAILLHGQFMAGNEMPSEHLATPAAFQANDIIPMNRSPDRDGRCPLSLGFGCRFSEADERPMERSRSILRVSSDPIWFRRT